MGQDKSGIYLLTCVPTGASYVGSSVQIYKRWYAHRRALRLGVSQSHRLQRAWNEYGEAAFDFEIVEECAREDLMTREQHYIDTLNPTLNTMQKTGVRPTHELLVAANKATWTPERHAMPGANRKDPELCRNLLHPWVKGQRTCKPCRDAGMLRSHLKRKNSPDYERDYSYPMTDETRAKMGVSGRKRGLRTDLTANNTSGVRGISWSKLDKKWGVQKNVRGVKCQRRFEDRADAERFAERIVALAQVHEDPAAIRAALAAEFPLDPLAAYRGTKSGERGVWWHERKKRFVAYAKGKQLGSFKTLDEANAAVRARILDLPPVVPPPRASNSGARGVWFDARRNRFLAGVQHKYLGCFKTLDEAVEAVRASGL